MTPYPVKYLDAHERREAAIAATGKSISEECLRGKKHNLNCPKLDCCCVCHEDDNA